MQMHLDLNARDVMSERVPIVVIVGGGFAGLSAAKALRRAPVRLVLIDRTKHYLFQPLLYQVAISVLSPAQIASPIREMASGATHSYFGQNDFEQHALGLKTLADAVAVRNKMFQAFEQAEAEEDTHAHRDLLTFVLSRNPIAGFTEFAGFTDTKPESICRRLLFSWAWKWQEFCYLLDCRERGRRDGNPYPKGHSKASGPGKGVMK
jgi:hypothetical protein